MSSNMVHEAWLPPGAGGASRPAGDNHAGLVLNKTSHTHDVSSFIPFSRELVTERRLKRMRRSCYIAGNLHQSVVQRSGKRDRAWFVTLTYRGVDDWSPKHISACMNAAREWCRRQGAILRFLWVAELQKRGALHYHIVIWLPRSLSLPKFDKRGWWPHGFTNVQLVKSSAVAYVMKYVSKSTPLHRFPKGARIYAFGGLEQVLRRVTGWINLPEWIKLTHGVGEVVRKAFGFVVRATGEIMSSPYEVKRSPSGLELRLLSPLPERFHSGPYSSFSPS